MRQPRGRKGLRLQHPRARQRRRLQQLVLPNPEDHGGKVFRHRQDAQGGEFGWPAEPVPKTTQSFLLHRWQKASSVSRMISLLPVCLRPPQMQTNLSQKSLRDLYPRLHHHKLTLNNTQVMQCRSPRRQSTMNQRQRARRYHYDPQTMKRTTAMT
jgi:hypothetical protein